MITYPQRPPSEPPSTVRLGRDRSHAVIASNKGRGKVLWGILGFLFTIIALIVIAILPRKD